MSARTIGELSDGYGWTPTDTDPNHGGPDTLNPLLNEDGTSAIHPEWPEPRGHAPASAGGVLASGGGSNRHARAVHQRTGARPGNAMDRIGQRVTLSWASAYGAEVELVRRAFVVTRGGAGMTRWRHPLLDGPGSVETAPWWRMIPGTLRVTRSRGGVAAEMGVEIEYVGPGTRVMPDGAPDPDPDPDVCTACADWMAANSTAMVDGEAAFLLAGPDTMANIQAALPAAAAALLEENICDLPEDVMIHLGGMFAHGTPTDEVQALSAFLSLDPEDYPPTTNATWVAHFRCGDQESEA